VRRCRPRLPSAATTIGAAATATATCRQWRKPPTATTATTATARRPDMAKHVTLWSNISTYARSTLPVATAVSTVGECRPLGLPALPNPLLLRCEQSRLRTTAILQTASATAVSTLLPLVVECACISLADAIQHVVDLFVAATVPGSRHRP